LRDTKIQFESGVPLNAARLDGSKHARQLPPARPANTVETHGAAFFLVLSVICFFFGFCRLVSCRYTAKQQQSHSTPKSLKRERCKIRTFAPGSSGICQIQDIYIDIYKLRHYLSSDRQRTNRNKSVIVMDWCDYCTHAQKALCAGS